MSNLTDPIGGPLVFFGDSLSDPSNLFDQAEGLIEETVRLDIAGPTGAASNGPTWAETFDDLTGASESYNYAVAGAEAIGTQSLLEFAESQELDDDVIVPLDDPGLQWGLNLAAQVDRFAVDFAGEDLSTTTAVIFIGGNDFGNIDLTRPAAILLVETLATLSGIIDSVEAQVRELAAFGVGHFVIANLPFPLFFPALQTNDPVADLQSIAVFDKHNDNVAELVKTLGLEGLDVELLDMNSMTKAIVDDPSSFGIIAPLDLSLRESDPLDLAGYDEDQIAFWDSLHPTEAVHALLAAYADRSLTDGAIFGSHGGNVFSLDNTDDVIFAGAGRDGILGGGGDDIVFGMQDDDALFGNGGADQLSGGTGDDRLYGGGSADVLDGGQDNDLLYGNGGNDVLIDGIGSDSAYGGRGNDTFIWTEAALFGGTNGNDTDWLDGGSGVDSLYIVISQALLDTVTGLSLDDALGSLGISLTSVEDIFIQVGRGDIAGLSDQGWYAQADLWGLV